MVGKKLERIEKIDVNFFFFLKGAGGGGGGGGWREGGRVNPKEPQNMLLSAT